MFFDLVMLLADLGDWLFPPSKYCNDKTCYSCNKPIDWVEKITLEHGMFLFVKLPIGIIIFSYFPSWWTVFLLLWLPYAWKAHSPL